MANGQTPFIPGISAASAAPAQVPTVSPASIAPSPIIPVPPVTISKEQMDFLNQRFADQPQGASPIVAKINRWWRTISSKSLIYLAIRV